MVFDAVGHRMGHMVGQDQKTFDQRSRQHHNNGKGDIRDQIAKPPADHRQSEKCDDRGQGCGKHWQRHATGSVFGRLDRAFTAAGAPIRMFTNHNRIVDHDSKRDNQGKQRDHINRDPRQIH